MLIMLTQHQLKIQAATAAVDYIVPHLTPQSIVGVGTGSTVDCFIDALAAHKARFSAAVSSSERSTQRLQDHGIPVLDLNAVSDVAVYVDGADEIDAQLAMIKGGGAALTREKIVASVARQFVCIVDDSKCVDRLGAFPVPVEVIPLAREAVGRRLTQLGGRPVWRESVVTDNGGYILDVHGWRVDTAAARRLEQQINAIAGVVSCGFFAVDPADVALIAGQAGLRTVRSAS